jgi:hypothetical protein
MVYPITGTGLSALSLTEFKAALQLPAPAIKMDTMGFKKQ